MKKETFEDPKQLYERLEYGFTIVFMAFLSVVTLSVMVYAANEYAFSSLNEILAVSRRTPWGIITSLFVHANEKHLLNNMIALFVFFLLLLGSNVFHSKGELKRRIFTTLLLMICIPIVLNLLFIIYFPELKLIGSSSIIYTLEGRCIGYSLINSLEPRKVRKSVQKERRVLLASSLSNLIVFVSFFLNLLLYPLLSPSTGLQLIVWIHSLAFTGGFVTVMFYALRRQFKTPE
jgi:membrane associated rhomboid family serine protease